MYYFKRVKNGKIVSVEAKSVDVVSPNFIKATKAECDNFIASLPLPVITPTRDLAAEVDEIEARIGALEKR